MKAVVYHEYGSPDVLQFRDVEMPQPRPNELRIRMRAASVNPADLYLLRGSPYMLRLQIGLKRPKNNGVGLDFAGVVDAVGADVTTFRAGDEVFGQIADFSTGRTRALAEYLCVDAAVAVNKPHGIGFAEIATLPLAGCTALYAVRDYGQVTSGQHVLINGAGGGVGVHAVQLAKHFGATVTAVCSEAKISLMHDIGADHVIDYRKHDFTAGSTRYDAIIDTVSSQPLRRCRRVLVPRGRFIWVGGTGTNHWFGPLRLALKVLAMPLIDRGHRWIVVSNTPTAEDLATLVGLLEQGVLRAVIDRRYPLGDAADAIRHLEKGHACGKIVVEI
ncbi:MULTISPECIES: NAD(P)-dependent alcohol dehydrogenase [unclassified Lysobacter]|uniref:NAD(P)-dependent alcohol dehydrogenase n=1 Tax=unclassified Lysobacter TaxID=2635362 RepID=UPI001BE79C0F|nr:MULTISPECIES: NAD(P)-dependent alcohol dehydrogenase [unclassified Lysobacter]MBT2744881.1 NAD(P)-dependent alcohol dehydrogenase [Lysobacter sp. ISL-42]MBT2752126.1 NAD(P)-dependent alcohol dehydrogenase [Lysobacter sp. ISL-50]MBT2778623.1 NAD(P)-dependent alcohol dehydrogenase [Lysobacter sp. ISL-54]MBT2780446.1 NAD(P)-dependent alcohol dehydrogenase [Lysobacter sp. ISL-52]